MSVTAIASPDFPEFVPLTPQREAEMIADICGFLADPIPTDPDQHTALLLTQQANARTLVASLRLRREDQTR